MRLGEKVVVIDRECSWIRVCMVRGDGVRVVKYEKRSVENSEGGKKREEGER